MRQERDELRVSGPKPLSSALVVLGLGVNAWIATIGWLQVAIPGGGVGLPAAAAALLVLTAGVSCHVWGQSERATAATRLLLLCGYPTALVAVVAAYPEATIERAHTPLSLMLGALSLLAYAAGAAQSVSPTLAASTLTAHPHDFDVPHEPAPRRLRARARVVIAVAWTLAALAIALIAPMSPAYSDVQRTWGDAAAAAAVLTALVASALAVTSVALFLGSMLRLADAEPPLRAAEARTRIAMLLFLALLGAVVYVTIIK